MLSFGWIVLYSVTDTVIASKFVLKCIWLHGIEFFMSMDKC